MVINFKKEVFEVVKKIPKGKTATYKEVAVLAGRPRARRGVENILSKNFNPKIPCHRVIRSDDKIGGYNCGKSKKKYFLKFSNFHCRLFCFFAPLRCSHIYLGDKGNFQFF